MSLSLTIPFSVQSVVLNPLSTSGVYRIKMKPSVFWSVLGLFLFPSVSGSGEGPTIPYFRILAPQFLCSSSASNDSDFTPPSSITIA